MKKDYSFLLACFTILLFANLCVAALMVSQPGCAATVSDSPAVGTAPAALCAGGPPLAGVYHPGRLIVQQPCGLVSGTVEQRSVEGDGDIHVWLALDAPYQGAINSKNTQYEHGYLVVEIIPADQSRVHVPPLGAHIAVIGPYVKDNRHGWMELHPARYIIPAADWSGECTPTDSSAAQAGSC